MRPLNVLYSFPHDLGAQRICLTAWQQVEHLPNDQTHVTALCGSLARPLSRTKEVVTTLSIGRVRVPRRIAGRERCLKIHDLRTAQWLEKNHERVDLLHAWPGSAIRTIQVAKKHGVVTLLERPNTHTQYAFEAAELESEHCGVKLSSDHDHAFDQKRLEQELLEYAACDFLLCPSEFVKETFTQRGIPESKLIRHRYGYDENRFHSLRPDPGVAKQPGITTLYAGVCEPRKGLHYLLRAWHESGAHAVGRLRICGGFVPGYRESLEGLLDHPSIEVMGHRSDLPDLMRQSDLFVLSSVEEGSALVTYEAMASGCVILVSDATGAPCVNGESGLVHPMRDVSSLARDLSEMHRDADRRESLRTRSIEMAQDLTWRKAGEALLDAYRQALRHA